MPATDGVRRPLHRIRLVVCLAAVAMAGCAAPATSGTPFPDPGAGPDALPGAEEFLPAGVAGATVWTPLSSLPNEFDISARFPSPEALADAYVTELEAGWAGGPLRPTFEVATISERDGGTVMAVTELGPGDDSVVGIQYALVIGRHADGWTLDGLWGRSLCRREVDRPSQLCV